MFLHVQLLIPLVKLLGLLDQMTLKHVKNRCTNSVSRLYFYENFHLEGSRRGISSNGRLNLRGVVVMTQGEHI
jgi:hypothetical protein